MRNILILGAALMVLSSAGHTAELKCDVGPITKTFGGATWLVYACSDGLSLALITPQESKAFPFVFNLHAKASEHTYELNGEGTGDKMFTDAAAHELSALTSSDIGRLLSEAREIKRKL